MEAYRRLLRVFIFMACLLVIGATGYHYLEDRSWFDGLYMTVTSLTTVDFGEVRPLTAEGRLFTIGLIAVGVSVMGYAFTQMISFVVEGHFHGIFKGKRMERMIEGMSGHYIVCGFGRIGHAVVQEFVETSVPFVLITAEAPSEDIRMGGKEVPLIIGDATDEDVLKKAGIERAKGLVTALPDDADNVLVTMTARDMNLDIIIVARASQDASIRKLHRAGANRVISPYDLGGRRMASIVLRPSVMDFLDVIMHSGEVEIRLEEITIPEKSSLDGKTIREARVGETTGAVILAVHTLEGKTITNPGASHTLRAWEQLIVMGRSNQIQALREIAEK